MAPRGEVALVAADLGFRQGHLDHHVFVALILVIVAAAVVAPLLVAGAAWQYRGEKFEITSFAFLMQGSPLPMYAPTRNIQCKAERNSIRTYTC
jgi:hypothetical protein